jgi:hypothetical protein
MQRKSNQRDENPKLASCFRQSCSESGGLKGKHDEVPVARKEVYCLLEKQRI